MKKLYCSILAVLAFSAFAGVEFSPNLIERIEVVDYAELPGFGTVPWKFIKPSSGFESMLSIQGKSVLLTADKPVKLERFVDNDTLRQSLSFRFRCAPAGKLRLRVDAVAGFVVKPLLDETLSQSGEWRKIFSSPRILPLTDETRGNRVEDSVGAESLRITFELTSGAELDLTSVRLVGACDRLNAGNTPFFTASGKPVVGIRLPEQPDYWTTVAAEKLRKYLFAMTGVLPPFTTGGEDPASINLGFAPPAELQKAPENSYLVCSGENVSVYGKASQDLIPGVYDLLRRCGVRFWSRDLQEIPSCAKISFPVFRSLRSTPFMIRHYKENGDALGMGYSPSRLCAPQFHRSRRGVPYHTNSYIVPEKLYLTHPEYFALQKNGKRNDPRKHIYEKPLCHSNPDVYRLHREKAGEWLRKMPQAKICWITGSDHYKWCVCPGCRSLDRKPRVYTHMFMEFLNRLARDVRTEFPGRKIGTFAYSHTSEPVPGLKLEPELWVTYALYPPYFTSLSVLHSPANDRGWKQLRGWQQNIAPARLAGFDYPVLYGSQFSLTAPFEAMNEKIDYFRKNHFGGITFCDVTVQFGPLMEYVWGKMFWDASADIPALVREHMNFYYGKKSAPYMLEYFRLLYRHVRETNRIQCCEYKSTGMVDAAFLEKAYPLLDKALAEALPNTRAWRAIRRDKAVLLYTEIDDFNVNNQPLHGDYKRFARNAAELIRLLGRKVVFSGRKVPYNQVNEWFSFVTGVAIAKRDYWNDPVMKKILADPEKWIVPRLIPVVPAGKVISPRQMSGGQFTPRYSYQCAPRPAMNVLRKSSSWSVANAFFEGGKSGVLVIHGAQGIPRLPIRIELNGQCVFDGPVQFQNMQNGWGTFTVPLPEGGVKAGRNQLTIRNLCPDPKGNAPYTVGWLMISHIEPKP